MALVDVHLPVFFFCFQEKNTKWVELDKEKKETNIDEGRPLRFGYPIRTDFFFRTGGRACPLLLVCLTSFFGCRGRVRLAARPLPVCALTAVVLSAPVSRSSCRTREAPPFCSFLITKKDPYVRVCNTALLCVLFLILLHTGTLLTCLWNILFCLRPQCERFRAQAWCGLVSLTPNTFFFRFWRGHFSCEKVATTTTHRIFVSVIITSSKPVNKCCSFSSAVFHSPTLGSPPTERSWHRCCWARLIGYSTRSDLRIVQACITRRKFLLLNITWLTASWNTFGASTCSSCSDWDTLFFVVKGWIGLSTGGLLIIVLFSGQVDTTTFEGVDDVEPTLKIVL